MQAGGAKTFGQSIEKAFNLKKLTISHCEITIAGCYDLLRGLKMNKNLTYIDLSHNDFRSGTSNSDEKSKNA